MLKNFKFISLILSFVLISGIITACTVKKQEQKQKTFVFVPKSTNIPFMQRIYDGFKEECKSMDIIPLYSGPEKATAEEQIQVLNHLRAQRVDGIVVDANDKDALEPILKSLMNDGIKVISVDSAVNMNSRQIHVQATAPERMGRTLIQTAYEILDGKGGFAILSASEHMTIQNEWIKWMKAELEENPEKYKDMPLLKIAYGDDEPVKSMTEARALLNDPQIKLIISPTTIGMLASGKAIKDRDSKVKLTGLGLPSEMWSFIESGICPKMFLWNPIDQGKLSAFTLKALLDGKVSGKAGEKLPAGNMGEMVIQSADDGGTEIILGDPFPFDKSNIRMWRTIF